VRLPKVALRATFGYDAGDLVTITDPLGRTTTRFLDGAGRVVQVTDPLGQRTRYEYDRLNTTPTATSCRSPTRGTTRPPTATTAWIGWRPESIRVCRTKPIKHLAAVVSEAQPGDNTEGVPRHQELTASARVAEIDRTCEVQQWRAVTSAETTTIRPSP
jgi:hypothetical protein